MLFYRSRRLHCSCRNSCRLVRRHRRCTLYADCTCYRGDKPKTYVKMTDYLTPGHSLIAEMINPPAVLTLALCHRELVSLHRVSSDPSTQQATHSNLYVQGALYSQISHRTARLTRNSLCSSARIPAIRNVPRSLPRLRSVLWRYGESHQLAGIHWVVAVPIGMTLTCSRVAPPPSSSHVSHSEWSAASHVY
jgi:hypothetical protein